MSVGGWLAQAGPRLRAVRGGLRPVSALRIAAGDHRDVRLCGVRLGGADRRSVANTAVEVAAGEYAAPGFEIRPGERVVDCGSNVGAFAVWAASRGARVDAYEPHPETFAWLQRNTEGLPVHCVRAAVVVGSNAGTVLLDVDHDSDTQHGLATGPETADGLEVPAIPLANAIGDGCGLLKIDCEGAEFELLRSVPDTALRRARRIVCEVHDWHGDPAQLEARLHDAGYSTVRRPKQHGLSIVFAHRLGV